MKKVTAKDFLSFMEHRRLCSLGLLPSYLEREGFSLIYMVEDLIQLSNHDESGFILHQPRTEQKN
jgi:hypothetical protein